MKCPVLSSNQSDWIVHKPGKPMPVHGDIKVVTLLRDEANGKEEKFNNVSRLAGNWEWRKADEEEDSAQEIVAYSICIEDESGLPAPVPGFSNWSWHRFGKPRPVRPEAKVLAMYAEDGVFSYGSIGFPKAAGELNWHGTEQSICAYCVEQNNLDTPEDDLEEQHGDSPELPEGVEPW